MIAFLVRPCTEHDRAVWLKSNLHQILFILIVAYKQNFKKKKVSEGLLLIRLIIYVSRDGSRQFSWGVSCPKVVPFPPKTKGRYKNGPKKIIHFFVRMSIQ